MFCFFKCLVGPIFRVGWVTPIQQLIVYGFIRLVLVGYGSYLVEELCIHRVSETRYSQAPDSESSLMPVSSVPHVSDRLELHNNNWAFGILHPGPSESDVYSDVIQEAQSNDLLHTVRLSVRLDTRLHGNNARGAKYAV